MTISDLPEELSQAISALNLNPIQEQQRSSTGATFYHNVPAAQRSPRQRALGYQTATGSVLLYTQDLFTPDRYVAIPPFLEDEDLYAKPAEHTLSVLQVLGWDVLIRGTIQPPPGWPVPAGRLLTDRWIMRHADAHTDAILDLTALSNGRLRLHAHNAFRDASGPLRRINDARERLPGSTPEYDCGLANLASGILNLSALTHLARVTCGPLTWE